MSEGFSFKEMLQAVMDQVKSIDEKQDAQLLNQQQMQLGMNEMERLGGRVDEAIELLKDPDCGVLVRLTGVELHQEQQRIQIEARRSLRENVWLQLLGALALVGFGAAAGAAVVVFHIPH